MWKTHTMSNQKSSCEECGFVWDDVGRYEAISGINDSVTDFVDVIEAAGEISLLRPEVERWSIVEYAAHLRDVLLNLRERIILASVADNPVGVAIHRDESVALGFYSMDSVDDVPDELAVAAGLITKAIAMLPEGFENRTPIFSTASDFEVTIGWVVAQAFHESFHHLGDVRENVRMFAEQMEFH